MLNFSEVEFWNSTPRKINALLKVREKINNPNKEPIEDDVDAEWSDKFGCYIVRKEVE